MVTEHRFAELLAAAQLGEGAALTELWHRYAPLVAGFARARGAHEVDEVTSDVFLAAFAGLGGFAGDESGFRAWLFTIARRRVVDEVRRRRRAVPQVSWDSFGHDRPSPHDVADTVVLRAASRDMIAAMDHLTPEQREVILLRLVADLSIEQVAAVVGKRPGSVKSLQRRGLDALRRKLTPPDGVSTAAVRPLGREKRT